jgi:rsbT co-antagonist protein RsbR
MPESNAGILPDLLRRHESEILDEWLREIGSLGLRRSDVIREVDLRTEAKEFITALREAAQSGSMDPASPSWKGVREFMNGISRTRAQLGISPSETATFVFSLKKPLFNRLRAALASRPDELADQLWLATEFVDKLGLLTVEAHQRSREEVIQRQQQDMLELSTPVVALWEGVLALPMIGTLDSARTQTVMETLLQRIVDTGAEIAIIDITGVPTVDTLVAQHLLKTVTAARLMGADCIISGIRPQIAQTIVHLGVNLQDVVTKASLADAFALALRRTGSTITRR